MLFLPSFLFLSGLSISSLPSCKRCPIDQRVALFTVFGYLFVTVTVFAAAANATRCLCLHPQADRLLELGFQEEVAELVKSCPVGRQTLLFSATMNTKVDDLASLALNKVWKRRCLFFVSVN